MKLLFELFTEELPASEMSGLENRVHETLTELLKSRNIDFKDLVVFLTPRRIAFKLESNDVITTNDKKITGPPASIAFKDDKPTKALNGFLKKNSVSLKDVQIEKTERGNYVYIIEKGKNIDVKPIMSEIVHDFLHKLNFKKKMRWGSGEFEFVRPVHNITFTIDDEVIDFNFAGIDSTSYTYGHRFLSKGKIRLSYENYLKELEGGFVIADQNKRKEIILNQINAVCKKESADVVYDEELLEEIVNINEYPKIVVGEFEEEYLSLPKEVLITSMKDHQRYFAFLRKGKLYNKFAAVSNIETDDMNIIKTGYERVLRARFNDAKFFFKEDSSHKLEDFVEGLKNMTFHEKLGSQFERVKRIEFLSEFLSKTLNFDTVKAKRAAYLSKADLLTQMVYEFPELQGVMGKEYAIISNEDKEVAYAIYEQYLPKQDELPKTDTGVVLSLADKIDLITGGFIADLKPTGTKDPYALRRAALGIVRIIISSKINLNLKEVFEKSAESYGKKINIEEVIDFIKVRFKNYFSEYSYDTLDAIASVGIYDIYGSYLRLEALKSFFDSDKQKSKRFAVKRVFNIVKDFKNDSVDESLLKDKEEKALFEAILKIEEKSREYIKQKDYKGLLSEISSIENEINRFFDKVMVMDKNEKVRNNRLSLLNKLKKLVYFVADFKFLEI